MFIPRVIGHQSRGFAYPASPVWQNVGFANISGGTMSPGPNQWGALDTLLDTGKWFMRFEISGSTLRYLQIGVITKTRADVRHGTWTHHSQDTWGVVWDGRYWLDTAWGASGNDIWALTNHVELAFDADTGKFWYGVDTGSGVVWNGSGDPVAGTNECFTATDGPWYFHVGQISSYGGDGTTIDLTGTPPS